MIKQILATIVALTLTASIFAADLIDPSKKSGRIDGGELLPQIVAGGAWSTDIQVMHSFDSDTPQSFTIQFFGSDGLPQAMPVVGQGLTTLIVGVLQPRGTSLIRLAGGSNTLVGYAVLSTTEYGAAVFSSVITQVVPNRPDFQAAIPGLDDFMTNIQFPYRNDGPYTTTVAFVSGTSTNDITAIARNESGIEICRTSWTADDGQHESFLLTDKLPCTANIRGVVEIVPKWWASAIVFLFNDSGAFTTQIPYDVYRK